MSLLWLRLHRTASRTHLETATAGPRTVPVRSSIAGGKAQECSRPPRPSDVLRAGTARAPVGLSRCARSDRAHLTTVVDSLSPHRLASRLKEPPPCPLLHP